MSAVAIPFDPTFTMGHRSMFTWPGSVDSSSSNSSVLSASDFSSMTSGSEPSLTPPGGPKAMLPSPSHVALPIDHDLKRHHERSRRESKMSARLQRASSVNSYTSTSPISIPDVSNAMSLPVYTTAPASVSLLSEPAQSLSPQSYMAPYSPPMGDHGAQVFAGSYPHTMQPSYTMSMEYPTYAAPSDYSARASPIAVGQDPNMVYQMPPTMTTGAGVSQEGSHVRVVQSRPKPRCWEHGCNGRQFSTFSNLLRHQREKSGQAAKATCPNCGAEFTRTTARNGHLLHDKCKQRRSS